VNGALSPIEIDRLPDRLKRRHWAAEISHGVPGLCELDRAAVRRECRAWIAWIDGLGAGSAARYVGIAIAIKDARCEIAAAWRANGETLFSITVPTFADRFLVGPTDLAPL
jgi:hypothetical protein